jgi:hypothetical protein
MLFNLTTRCTFKSLDHDAAIYCEKGYGPCFGSGELGISNQPFNGDNYCISNVILPGYHIGEDSEGRNMLTNLKCDQLTSFFTISELEVWEIIFEK